MRMSASSSWGRSWRNKDCRKGPPEREGLFLLKSGGKARSEEGSRGQAPCGVWGGAPGGFGRQPNGAQSIKEKKQSQSRPQSGLRLRRVMSAKAARSLSAKCIHDFRILLFASGETRSAGQEGSGGISISPLRSLLTPYNPLEPTRAVALDPRLGTGYVVVK